MKLKWFPLTLIAVTVAIPAQAYHLFDNQEDWEAHIQNRPIVTENFNIPNQLLAPRPFALPSGLTAEDIDAIGGAAVINGQLRTGLAFPTSLEEFAFPEPVEAFAFNFTTPEPLPGSQGAKEFALLGDFGEIPLNGTGFLGILATDNDPPIESFQTFGSGTIGSLDIDDLEFSTTIPEPSFMIATLLVSKIILLKRR
ncbi:MAG: hypothetical protein EA365_15705 [Gloeocapsa sp. DLM2.Bin57]|nr:MAG: hypothetical protein EA365_15705 [Gloeocapsa sp. DLM2.Bin57]